MYKTNKRNGLVPVEDMSNLLANFTHLEGKTVQHIRTENVYRVVCFSLAEAHLPEDLFVLFTYETVGINKVRFTRPVSDLTKFVPYNSSVN
jgi:hypothetical protein